jgi:hypothetical protein
MNRISIFVFVFRGLVVHLPNDLRPQGELAQYWMGCVAMPIGHIGSREWNYDICDTL